MAKHEQNSGAHVRREAEAPPAGKKRRPKTGSGARTGGAVRKNSAVRRSAAPVKRTKKPAPKVRAVEEEAVFSPEEESRPAPKRRSGKKKRRAMRRLRNLVIILGSLLIALVCGALYAGSCVSASTTVLPRVYLDGIDLSGLTREETEQKLKEQGWDQAGQTPMRVQLPAGVSFEVDRLKAGSALSVPKAAQAVFDYGHSGNWIGDLGSYLHARISPVNLGSFQKTLDEDYIAEQVKAGLADFAEVTGGPIGYEIDKENEELVIAKGAGGLQLDEAKLSAAVRQGLLADETDIVYDTLENPPVMPDFTAIHVELAREPQDAYFVEGGWDVVDEIVGCDFVVEQAQELWQAAHWMEQVRIPLSITYPAVTGESLRSLLFRDLLGSMTTYYPNSIPNRVSNISLATSKLDGIILYPGDSLSYNQTIGQRTAEAGFLTAAAYSDGEVVEEIGGGVCQVSSTLYSAVLYAQLGIKSRDSHYFKVDYLDWGMDATVSWPTPDFVFYNNKDYPIKIVAIADPVERYVTMEIWGTNVDQTHIEITYERYQLIDETYGVHIGWNVYSKANVYDADNNLIEVRDLPASTYHFHDEDIAWPPEKYAEGG